MRQLQLLLLGISTFFLFNCQSKSKDKNSTNENSSRETRTVNVTYSLDIEHNETIYLKSKQDITTSYPGGIQDITISGEYLETIAGLSISSGDRVKLAFNDVTDCHPDDDCIYTAVLSIKVDGEQVANGNFNCRDGQGSGEIQYQFD